MSAERINIKVRLDEGAFLPVKAHEWENGVPGDAGYDVRVLSVETECIEPAYGCSTGWVRVKIDTGVHVQPPPGYRIMAVPNSRITKSGFSLPNSPGTIDANYRGSIRFIYLYPYETPVPESDGQGSCTAVGEYTYHDAARYAREFWAPGTVCGQLIVVPDYDSVLEVCGSLDETSRGFGGFGSTQDGKEGGNEEK